MKCADILQMQKQTNINSFVIFPIAKGKCLSTQPLTKSFLQKTKKEMTELEAKRLKQINRFNKEAKVVQILYKNIGRGWVFVPSTSHVKIDTYLELYCFYANIIYVLTLLTSQPMTSRTC
jgi:hypothetical protein